jgi:hypothetical protein
LLFTAREDATLAVREVRCSYGLARLEALLPSLDSFRKNESGRWRVIEKVRPFQLAEVSQMIDRAEIHDTKTLVELFYAHISLDRFPYSVFGS